MLAFIDAIHAATSINSVTCYLMVVVGGVEEDHLLNPRDEIDIFYILWNFYLIK